MNMVIAHGKLPMRRIKNRCIKNKGELGANTKLPSLSICVFSYKELRSCPFVEFRASRTIRQTAATVTMGRATKTVMRVHAAAAPGTKSKYAVAPSNNAQRTKSAASGEPLPASPAVATRRAFNARFRMSLMFLAEHFLLFAMEETSSPLITLRKITSRCKSVKPCNPATILLDR